ncbi:MAG TPA: dephospho-CoA kinase [Steroidobacteraceae bacterium]|nr:dephospho-CoA kinase [Steroidobacteraceae bacterium]
MTARAFRVGLTGGIASGKSTVARLFEALGVPVIDTDVLAREVVAPGQPVLAQIAARFGAGVLTPDGALDRAALRKLIFSDPAARADLERLTHPAIRALLEARSAAAGGEYQIHVIPLLVETGGRDRVDRVLVVDCSEELQIRRLQARDGSTLEQARAILAAQASRAARLAVADDVIENSGDLGQLRDRVAALHLDYLARARQAPTRAF